jgi:hypothetical protein
VIKSEIIQLSLVSGFSNYLHFKLTVHFNVFIFENSRFSSTFPIRKRSYCPHIVCLSVSASSLQRVGRLRWFMARSKARWSKDLKLCWNFFFWVEPGLVQRDLKSLTSLYSMCYVKVFVSFAFHTLTILRERI